MSSTPVRDAASISRNSRCLPALISSHAEHSSHGLVTGPSADWQFKHLARIRAIVVFPTPRVPANKYA